MEACNYLPNVAIINTGSTTNSYKNLDSLAKIPFVPCNPRKNFQISKTRTLRIDSTTVLRPRVLFSDTSFFSRSHSNGLRGERGTNGREEIGLQGVVRVRAGGGEGENSASPKPPAGRIPLESRRPVAPIYIPPETPKELPPVFVYDEYIPRKKPRQFPRYNSEEEGPPALGGMGPNHRSGYVALIGRPNAGKSTLLNQLIGQKLSIVTEKPQTTRHRILGISSGRDYQMILYDTPGVMSHRMHKLDEVMMQNVRNAAVNADCIILVVDITVPPEQVMDMLQEAQAAAAETRPLLLVLNKKDRIKPGEVKNKFEWYENSYGGDVMVVSAKYGQGCEEIRKWALSKLPLGPAYYPRDIVSEHPERFFVAEIVREKILLLYAREIPYVSQVNVVTYIERDGRAKDFVELDIIVEKESQKGILIGKDGNALKALATAARLEIEEFVGRPIFLEIRVKVKENWRQDEKLLQVYGLNSKQM